MADYIDRDAVYDAILVDDGLNAYGKAYCIDIVRKITASDVAPVRTGMNKSTVGQYGKKEDRL